MSSTSFLWQCTDRTIPLGKHACIMGILNTTPDSFSDGGKFGTLSHALDRALEMEAEGAQIIDIGGESSRPGAEPVSLNEELQRTIPLIEKIHSHSKVAISIDTTKAEVARQALEAGAQIVNDISALEGDSNMAEVIAEFSAGVVLMHKRGTAKTMQNNPTYNEVVSEVASYLKDRIVVAENAGIQRAQIVLDPGIGFGKTTAHNLELLRHLSQFADFSLPLLLGASRKNFIGELTGRKKPEERKAGSLAVALWARSRGAHILRVHDVIDTCEACTLLDTLLGGDYLCFRN